MAINYTPLTDFLTKDTLPKEDPDKVILGADFDAEFNAISTAFAGAAPTNNPVFTGTATFDGVTVNTVTINGLVTAGSLDIGGNATVAGTLDVTGAATFGNTLDVASDATVGGNLDVTGTLTADGSQLPTFEDVQDIVSGAELGPISELGDLSNVDEAGKVDGDYIVWNEAAGNWVPKTEEALDLSALTTDVRTTAAIKAGTYEETLAGVPDSSATQGFFIENAVFQGTQYIPSYPRYNNSIWVSPDGLSYYAAMGDQAEGMSAGYINTPYELGSTGGSSDVSASELQSLIGSGDGRYAFRGMWASDNGLTFSVIQGSSTDSATWGQPLVFRTSVPWNLSIANLTLLSRGQQGGQIDSITSCIFSQDGLKAWVGRSSRAEIKEYALSSAFAFGNGTGHSVTTHSFSEFTGCTGIQWGDDGYTFMVNGGSSLGIFRYELTTPYDLSTATHNGEGYFSPSATSQSSALGNPPHFYKNGERMVLTGGNVACDVYDIDKTITTATLDCATANNFDLTLDASVEVEFVNAPASGTSYACSLTVKQDATGGHAITWPSSVVWAGGEAPELTADASAEDVFVFMTSDGGTTWYGFTSGQAFA